MKKTRLQLLYENSQRNRRAALNSYRYSWPIDPKKQAEIADKIRAEITKADEGIAALLTELRDEYGATPALRKFFENFNSNSGQQMARLFYEILEEPIRVRTKQGAASTGKAALEKIQRTGGEEAKHMAGLLSKRKTFAKLEEAYIHNLDGVTLVRPSAHVTAQVGGRWSYRDPALQTVPAAIKPMFVAHPGSWMVACDLAGAEYRTMALQSGCVGMLEAFNNDRDLHKNTASVLFGVEESAVTPKMRKISKGVGLGFHYSVLDMEGAAAGLYGQVGHLAKELTFEMMLGALRRLAAARPEIMQFKQEIWESAQRRDYVQEPLNRRRRDFYGKPKDTEAFNFPQQAMIAAIMDAAVQLIDAEFRQGEGLHLQRHDEVILGGPDPLRLCQLLWQHMRQTHRLGEHQITFEIEYTITKRWGEGIDITPKKQGTHFHAGCPCGWENNYVTLSTAVGEVCSHYDACEKQEGTRA